MTVAKDAVVQANCQTPSHHSYIQPTQKDHNNSIIMKKGLILLSDYGYPNGYPNDYTTYHKFADLTPESPQPDPHTPPPPPYDPGWVDHPGPLPPDMYYHPLPHPIPPSRRNRKRRWLLIAFILVFLAIVLIGLALATANAPKPAGPTSTGVQQTWQVTHTFGGNGIKKTAVFTVPDDWKIDWTCNPSSFYSEQYNVIVSVMAPDGSPVDMAAINSICRAGNTGGTTEEHQGGQVYLDVNSEALWVVQVEELK